MLSSLSFALIFFVSRTSSIENFEDDGKPSQNIAANPRSAISGGIILEDDYNFNRGPHMNGGQQGYWNHDDHRNHPYDTNTNSYNKYPGSYYENQQWNNNQKPWQSAWEWLSNVLSYCFTQNPNSGHNNYNNYYSDYNHQEPEPIRGNRLSYSLFKRRSAN